MKPSLIFEIVLFIIFIISNLVLVIFGIIRNRKTNKELEEYKKYCDILNKKQRISFDKKVDYKSLYESIDYLTYNSKLYEESRKLTEEEFKTLKQDYMFYTFPYVYLAVKKESKNE